MIKFPVQHLALVAVLAAATATQAFAATSPKPAPKPATAPSVCKGLPEAGCKANTACSWIVPKKVDKSGKQEAPYCRKKPGFTKKTSLPDKSQVPAPKT